MWSSVARLLAANLSKEDWMHVAHSHAQSNNSKE